MLDIRDITKGQLKKFLDYFEDDELNVESWHLTETKRKVCGFTIMDNNSLHDWLKENMPEVRAAIEFSDDLEGDYEEDDDED